MIDVRELGAAGDGCTDNTNVLQKAIDTAAETQATLYVPEGVFLTSTLRFHPHVGMAGSPTWSYGDAGGSILRLSDNAAKCLVDISGATGVTLSGLCLDGGNLGTGIHGILTDNPKYNPMWDTPRDGGNLGTGIHGVLADNPNSDTIGDTPRIERCRLSRFSGAGSTSERR